MAYFMEGARGALQRHKYESFSGQALGDRFDPAPLLLCHVMAELSSGLPSAKGNMLRARAASQVQLFFFFFFFNAGKKRRGKVARGGGRRGRSDLVAGGGLGLGGVS